jgi:hypothetical protein
MIVEVKVRGGKAYSVTLDGVDVTRRCFYADDERGEVLCYALNPEGQMFCVPGTCGATAIEILHGTVVITEVAPSEARKRGLDYAP